jgi:hypothetical protein
MLCCAAATSAISFNCSALGDATSPLSPAADAGADYSTFLDKDTDYDLVQTAANNGQFEAVVKLVEAGASWRLQRGQQRVMAGSIYYVPEMLAINKPGLKVRILSWYARSG